ncbi:MAG: hypothetical protein ACRDVW_01255, partial [Acidimicrobiales bacterium]
VQNVGGILAGGATDPNSAPLVVLLALAYWPLSPRGLRTSPPSLGPLGHRCDAVASTAIVEFGAPTMAAGEP